MADRNGELDPTEAWPPVGTDTYDATAGAFASLSSPTEVACALVAECGVWDEPDSGIWHFPTHDNQECGMIACDHRTCPEHCSECNPTGEQ